MRVEYRWGRPLAWRLRPFVGVMGTADAAAYGYFGLGLDLGLSERVALTPNVAAGLYGDGSGKDLGHAVEFRSGLELSYRLDDGTRLGAAFHHTSNASLGDRNPGAESLVLTYSIPIARARGR
ncbi:MAG: acyloxyacyl hydrolase [Proteobacteria bacterium]|nr:acyloxyacyl hydrolase [Pseudomonadota bacterium]